jgi:hypothetical protein
MPLSPATTSVKMEAECYLFGLASVSRKDKLLSILTGYTAMKPVHFAERRIICQPPKPPPSNLSLGGSQSIAVFKNTDAAGAGPKEVFHAQLRKPLNPSVNIGKELDGKNAADGWSMLVYETPDPYTSVGLRNVTEIPLEGSFDTPIALVEGLGYT